MAILSPILITDLLSLTWQLPKGKTYCGVLVTVSWAPLTPEGLFTMTTSQTPSPHPWPGPPVFTHKHAAENTPLTLSILQL